METFEEIFQSNERQRVDVFVSQIADITRSRAVSLIGQGFVLLNDKTASKNDKLHCGDVVKVTIPEPVAYEVIPQNLNLDVLYEDNDLLFIMYPSSFFQDIVAEE
jgi:23S rRNA pseudouridine1911/1915/1917 synthase